MYSEKVMELFRHPKHVKEIKDADGIGKVGNPTCGDLMWLYIKVEKKQGKELIKDIGVKTFGCVAAIASSEALCSLAEGKTLEEALKITKKDIIRFMGGDVPDQKVHCSLLATEALKKAVEDYRGRV
ncbi:iron-sulfur cluster assembly scaffold protein [Candidatus Woesearchaeota archaeon]|nr:iron-sulfur cluster assembly scaffold protein [Candidatus Woesearchaeota archaeon]